MVGHSHHARVGPRVPRVCGGLANHASWCQTVVNFHSITTIAVQRIKTCTYVFLSNGIDLMAFSQEPSINKNWLQIIHLKLNSNLIGANELNWNISRQSDNSVYWKLKYENIEIWQASDSKVALADVFQLFIWIWKIILKNRCIQAMVDVIVFLNHSVLRENVTDVSKEFWFPMNLIFLGHRYQISHHILVFFIQILNISCKSDTK